MTDPVPVLLAAGASTRMGAHKLLLDFGGEPLVRRAARALLAAGFPELLVVLGRDPAGVRAALAGLPARFVENPDYTASEVPASLLCALDVLPPGAGVLMALADMPFVGAAHHARVRAAGADGRAALSDYGGVVAPPHLIPAGLRGAVAQAIRAGTPRPLPGVLGPLARTVAQPPEDLLDVDTPEDWARAQARLSGENRRV